MREAFYQSATQTVKGSQAYRYDISNTLIKRADIEADRHIENDSISQLAGSQ